MKFTGNLAGLSFDYVSGKQRVTVELNEDFREVYDQLKEGLLSVAFNKYKKKRSLDANAYYWVLVSKLAKRVEVSNEEIHNLVLSRYGFPEIVDGHLMRILIPDTEEAEKKVNCSDVYHLRPTSQVHLMGDGVTYRTYCIMRGSSTYNTEEMARIITGLISECRDAKMPDAEIMTPDEKRILKEKYGVDVK